MTTEAAKLGAESMIAKLTKVGFVLGTCGILVGCGGFGNSGGSSGNIFNRDRQPEGAAQVEASQQDPFSTAQERALGDAGSQRTTIWELISTPDGNTNVRVNKYLWNASLETLSFLPVESADPFTGVLVMGWGRAPGSGRQYRATILVQDPALDARSLKVSVQTRGGTASAETVRRIEDAILTRARQLRVRDRNL